MKNSQDINTIISLNDKIVYSGFIKAYELPKLLRKKKYEKLAFIRFLQKLK